MTVFQLMVEVVLDPAFLILMLIVMFLFPAIFFTASIKPPKKGMNYRAAPVSNSKKKDKRVVQRVAQPDSSVEAEAVAEE